MTGKEEKFSRGPQAETANTASVAASAEPTDQKKPSPAMLPPETSKGEKLYNKVVYQGIGYWLNLGLSVVVADYFLHGKGRPFYDRNLVNINNGFKAAKLDKVIGEKAMERATHVALGFVSLNSGGNIILVPMKLMEDRKRPIVHWMNKNIYHDQQLAPDGHTETPDEIYIEHEQPKQSWGNVLWRRVQAMAASIVFGLALDNLGRKKLDTPEVVNDKTVTHIDGQERFTSWVTNGAKKVFGSKTIPSGGAVDRYLGYTALDSINTVITSHIMHKTNGAKKAKLPHEIGDDVDPPGIEGVNEIVMLPKEKKPAQVAPSENDDPMQKYRKKSATPALSHTDRAKTKDGSMSITP